jgi:hypothetical protein
VCVSLAKPLSPLLNEDTGGDQLRRATEPTARMRE